MPLLIRIVTGLVAGALLYTTMQTDSFGKAAAFSALAVIWVIVGLALAAYWEDIE